MAKVQKTAIMGMENLIEGRDVAAGEHVKRTEELVSALVQELVRRKDPVSKIQAMSNRSKRPLRCMTSGRSRSGIQFCSSPESKLPRSLP